MVLPSEVASSHSPAHLDPFTARALRRNCSGGRTGSTFSSRKVSHLITILFSAGPAFWLGLQLNINNKAGLVSSNNCACNNKNDGNKVHSDSGVLGMNDSKNLTRLCHHWLQLGKTNETTRIDTSTMEQAKASAPSKNVQEKTRVKEFFNKSQIGDMVAGMAVTSKVAFTNAIDLGVPLDDIESGSSHVLLLYGRENAMPKAVKTAAKDQDQPFMIPEVDYEEAVAKCNVLKVWLLDHKGTGDTCWALVPQLGSYHVQTWRRLKPRDLSTYYQEWDDKGPLRISPRSMTDEGEELYPVPTTNNRRLPFEVLRDYFFSQEQVLKDLKATIVKDVKPYNESTIIVMVSNHGQSELLANFVCSARSRQLDISSVLVFATDEETADVAKSLGLATFYDKKIFGSAPTHASVFVGDRQYIQMMIIKAVCAQLVSALGYSFLYQDVDIVWFKHPLKDFFDQEWSKNYDIIFQDDGQHTQKFAPYHANSGCYFVRSNIMTRGFFDAVLFSSDMIVATASHQQAMASVLAEHVSLYGLRVKVIARETWDLPTGWHYNRPESYPYMKQHFLPNKGTESSHTILFHMSWTDGADDKIMFFQQMGEWYVTQKCTSTGQQRETNSSFMNATESFNLESCCLAKPEYQCHFRDKPSLEPCPNQPSKEDDSFSFW